MTHSPAPLWDGTNPDNHGILDPDPLNAALICAAPDLLAACKLAAAILEHSYDVTEAQYPESIECLKHLKEVISKAEPNEINET